MSCLGCGWAGASADPVWVVKGPAVFKIWLALLAVGVEVVALGWMVGSQALDWLFSGLKFS